MNVRTKALVVLLGVISAGCGEEAGGTIEGGKTALTINPANLELRAGGSATATISVKDELAWSLALSELPPGITSTFSAMTVTQQNAVRVTFTASKDATVGAHPITLSAHASRSSRTASATLNVTARPKPVAQVGLNDVAILYPLPTNTLDGLLAPGEAGVRGPLLSSEDYGHVPQLLLEPTRQNDEVWSTLRVVSVRLDPCAGVACVPQVRLVFQPMAQGGSPDAQDASIHAIYKLTVADFESLISEIVALRPTHDHQEPLDVHPVMASEGLAGPYATHLRRLLLAHIGTTNLVRMAFLVLAGDERSPTAESQRWRLEAVDKNESGYHAVPIVSPGVEAEFFIRSVDPTNEDSRHAEIVPEPESLRISLLYDAQQAKGASRQAQEEAVRAAVRLENPRIEHVDGNSCVTCHTTFSMRRWAASSLNVLPDVATDTFTSSYNLKVNSPAADSTRSLRAFGYVGRDAAISQRLVNDSALSAERIERP